MKPTEESADPHSDFAGDESTSVMAVDLLSSLTERSRRADVATPPIPVPISIAVEQPEPVTTMRPAARPQLLVVDDQYPVIGDEEPTVMMEEPEPTTLAVRSRRDSPAPLAARVPAPTVAAQLSLPRSVRDPEWAAELAPRALVTPRVVPLPAPELEATPAVGSRRSIALAAIALGVAAWSLGLDHHGPFIASEISSPAPSVSSVLVAPASGQTQTKVTLDKVRAALDSLLPSSASSARNESENRGRAKR